MTVAGPSRMVPKMRLFGLAGLLALAATLFGPPPAGALEPAVVRARYEGAAEVLTAGAVFFLALPEGDGTAAVGAAHSFDLARLTQASFVDFFTGHTGKRVGISARFLVPPGRPFSDPGSSLREDFVVFRLDGPPEGARRLQAEARVPAQGERVRLLGIPLSIQADEDDIYGRVLRASETRIEIDLDVPYDLRGWGGAPVLSYETGKVIGILQAAWPTESTLRVAATPMDAVLEALETPLADGQGKLFSAYAKRGPDAAAASSPKRTAAERRAQRASEPQESEAGPRAPPERKSLLGKNVVEPDVPLWVEIEHPEEGAVVGDPAGAFVAGRAVAPRGEYRQIDAVIVIDTSGSTREPTGVDINGNGVVGQRRGGVLGGVLDLSTTDPGDTVLAAEVEAARRLLASLDPRSTRVGLVTFAGEIESNGFFRRQRNPVVTEASLTTNYAQIEKALDRVLERGPKGQTNMAAGVNQATIELLGARGALSQANPKAEKVVLFFSDGQPTLPYGPGREADNVREVLRAGKLAARAGVRFYTFGIGEEALSGPVALIELAARTEGFFTPVRHPGDLLQVVEQVDFANVDQLIIRNKTTGDATEIMLKNPDGTFSALVPLEPGKNEIEVWARSSDGHEASRSLTVAYAPGAPDIPVPRPLLAQHNRLLQHRLLELRRERIEVEREQTEQTLKQLELEIEQERERAQGRAEEQRKELELDVDPDAEAESADPPG